MSSNELTLFFADKLQNVRHLRDNWIKKVKKSNCFIAGIRPGKNTMEYFNAIISRLTFVGSLYLIFVCIIPDILFTKYSIHLSIGGTSLLIIVSTVIDLITQFQSHVFSEKYNNVNKRRRVRIR